VLPARFVVVSVLSLIVQLFPTSVSVMSAFKLVPVALASLPSRVPVAAPLLLAVALFVVLPASLPAVTVPAVVVLDLSLDLVVWLVFSPSCRGAFTPVNEAVSLVLAPPLPVVHAFLAVSPCVVTPVVVVEESMPGSHSARTAVVCSWRAVPPAASRVRVLVASMFVPLFVRVCVSRMFLACLFHLPSCRGAFTPVNNAGSAAAERFLVVVGEAVLASSEVSSALVLVAPVPLLLSSV